MKTKAEIEKCLDLYSQVWEPSFPMDDMELVHSIMGACAALEWMLGVETSPLGRPNPVEGGMVDLQHYRDQKNAPSLN